MIAHIRPATLADAEPLSRLKRQAFRETFLEDFAIPYPPQDIAAFFDAHYSVPAITAELRDPEVAIWVAETADGALVGYAKHCPCDLPHPEASADQPQLSQLYLIRAAQGQRLGQRLMRTALDHAADHRPGPLWLGVWSGNAKAQAFYARLGFEKVGDYDFPVGSWIDHEYIFRRPG